LVKRLLKITIEYIFILKIYKKHYWKYSWLSFAVDQHWSTKAWSVKLPLCT